MMKKIIICVFAFFCFSGVCMGAEVEELTQPKLANIINQNNGKVILINFFATWCPPCRVEIPELVKLRSSIPADELEIIGLSVDENKEVLPDFLKQTGVNYPVYLAAPDITGSYDISSVPHNVLYAPTGQMVISEPGLAHQDLLSEIINDLMKKTAAKK